MQIKLYVFHKCKDLNDTDGYLILYLKFYLLILILYALNGTSGFSFHLCIDYLSSYSILEILYSIWLVMQHSASHACYIKCLTGVSDSWSLAILRFSWVNHADHNSHLSYCWADNRAVDLKFVTI